MTQLTTSNFPSILESFKNADRFMVGFDDLFDRLDRARGSTVSNSKYPPYNIIRHEENKYAIEIAAAGFKREDLDIQLEGDTVTVTGNVGDGDRDAEYLYHGLAKRPFTQKFTIADNIKVVAAKMVDGLLVIDLEREVPEELLPKQIPIL